MWLKALHVDAWHRGDDAGEDFAGDGLHLDHVRAAVAMLDGDVHTLVALRGEHDLPEMWVGGGNDGRYVVSCVFDDRSMTAWDRSRAGAPREDVVAGGQEGDYPAEAVLGRDIALRAAEVFAATGTLDPELSWVDAQRAQ